MRCLLDSVPSVSDSMAATLVPLLAESIRKQALVDIQFYLTRGVKWKVRGITYSCRPYMRLTPSAGCCRESERGRAVSVPAVHRAGEIW